MSPNVRILTDASFDEDVLKAKGPVLVDFWATWCPPCRMIGPSIEAVADRFAGKATVGKLDVDENPHVAERYGICSIPTLLLFLDGQVVEQRVGALPKAEIEAMVERPLLAATAAR